MRKQILTEKEREIHRLACQRWNRNHPHRDQGNYRRTSKKIRARNYIQKHPELLASECELCPEDDKRTTDLTAHHPDYDYPEIIVTTCRACHNWIDKGRD